MSIAFGWITTNGEMIAVSDRRLFYNGIFQNDTTEKTFSVLNNSMIVAHTGLLSFNGMSLKDHVIHYCQDWNIATLELNAFEGLINYIKEQLLKEELVSLDNKSVLTIFLVRIGGIPTRICYNILFDSKSSSLIVSLSEVSIEKGTFIPIGNKIGFSKIEEGMLNFNNQNPIQSAELAMLEAINEIQRIVGPNADCGGVPSIQIIN